MFDFFRRGAAARPQIRTMTPAELHQRMQEKDRLTILDVRSPDEYAHDGYIAGSRLIPLPALHQRSGELPKDQPIVIVCRSGNRSGVACEHLAALGITNTYNMVGGMLAWRRAGLPTR
jgi:rhodanese-related sulfurtransferase